MNDYTIAMYTTINPTEYPEEWIECEEEDWDRWLEVEENRRMEIEWEKFTGRDNANAAKPTAC